MLSHANNSTFFLEEKAQALLEQVQEDLPLPPLNLEINRIAYPVMVLENEDILVTKNTNPEMLGNC